MRWDGLIRFQDNRTHGIQSLWNLELALKFPLSVGSTRFLCVFRILEKNRYILVCFTSCNKKTRIPWSYLIYVRRLNVDRESDHSFEITDDSSSSSTTSASHNLLLSIGHPLFKPFSSVTCPWHPSNSGYLFISSALSWLLMIDCNCLKSLLRRYRNI